MATSTPPRVPFIEEITQGEVGSHVRFTKRALSRAGFMEWGEFTNVAGEHWIRALNAFKKVKGLKVNGVYDFATHEALRKTHRKGSRTEWAFDSFAIKGLTGENITPLEKIINKTIDAVDYAILHRDRMDYAQIRRMPDNSPFPNLPNPCDCSQFVTWAAKSGGWLQDPNYSVNSSRKWDDYGYTGTLWESGTTINGLSSARLLDLVFFGRPWQPGGAAHVGIVRAIVRGVVYIGHHGQNAGPFNSRADYRSVTGVRRYKIAA